MLRDEFDGYYTSLAADFGMGMTELRKRQSAQWFDAFRSEDGYVMRRAMAVLADKLERFPHKSDLISAINTCRDVRFSSLDCDKCSKSGMVDRKIAGKWFAFACTCSGGNQYRTEWRSQWGETREPLEDVDIWDRKGKN